MDSLWIDGRLALYNTVRFSSYDDDRASCHREERQQWYTVIYIYHGVCCCRLIIFQSGEEYENELPVSLLIIIDGRDNNYIYARYSVLYIKDVFACNRLFSLDWESNTQE